MPFIKSHIPWNKGKKGVMPIPWNKGKHPESVQGKNHPMYGKRHTIKTKNKISKAMQGKNCREKSCRWKGGVTTDKQYIVRQKKEYRHRVGISKKYRGESWAITKTPEEKKIRQIKYRQSPKVKLRQKLWKQSLKGRISQKKHNLIHRTKIKDLSIKTIQLVYEDNIKRYGTLTCYLCLKFIEFKKDHLEHRIPLSRGGTNEYYNLAVACQRCNCRKHNKTEKEYREELKKSCHLEV